MTQKPGLSRWFSWLAAVLVFSLACVYLSQWQFARRAEVVERNSLISGNYNLPPTEFSQALAANPNITRAEWMPVSLSGHYLGIAPLLVRNRPYNGQPGFVQVAVFADRLTGKLVLVNRGWLASGSRQDSPDVNPSPPVGAVQIIARIRVPESGVGKDAPRGQLPMIDPSMAAKQLGLDLNTAVYLRLASETPAPAIVPRAEPMPQLGEGNHLSYALQWILFALMALATLIWFIRDERRRKTGVQRAKRHKSQSQLDAAAEDAAAGDGPGSG